MADKRNPFEHAALEDGLSLGSSNVGFPACLYYTVFTGVGQAVLVPDCFEKTIPRKTKKQVRVAARTCRKCLVLNAYPGMMSFILLRNWVSYNLAYRPPNSKSCG